jgi:N-acetylmuramoyl-L-alanine amidase CwlA
MTKPLAEMVNIIKDFIPEGRPNRPGRKINPTHVTIHNTSNTRAGADAKAHSRFVRETGYYEVGSGPTKKKNFVSWHFTVDDKSVYQHLPIDENGWHAGSGNSKSIGIEICMNSGIDQGAANIRSATLAAGLINDLGIDINRVVTHKDWTGKACPTLLLNSGDKGSNWNAFVELIESMQGQLRREHISIADDIELKSIDTLRSNLGEADDDEPDLNEIEHEHMMIPEEFLSS